MVGTAHKLAVRPPAIVGDMGFNLPVDAKLRKKHRSVVVSAAKRKNAEEEAERRELEGLSNPAKKSRIEVRVYIQTSCNMLIWMEVLCRVVTYVRLLL